MHIKSPAVTFVVPCYKLAHLLTECVNSILAQSFGDLEVLIMDDCSPDNTAEVARSFADSRVQHVRNDPNLGHLRNYNKGIGMARGKYVWLISADDYLGSKHVLQRYVDLMEANPRVGYTFCPAIPVKSGDASYIEGWVASSNLAHGNNDRIINGRDHVKGLVKGNTIAAASGLVRKECYDKTSLFPLDMPWAGDWYLWCLFALHYDVGYFAEPMVCYRAHELSMTNKLWDEDVGGCCDEDIAIPWAIKREADVLAAKDISTSCLHALAELYAKSLVANRYRMSRPSMDMAKVESSLCENTTSEAERNVVRSRMFAAMGSACYWRGDKPLAREHYSRALKIDSGMAKVRVLKLLLALGVVGDVIRKKLK